MSNLVRIDYYGMEGAGRTLTEAKKDAGGKIRSALSGSYAPRILVWRDHAVLIWREPGGWCRRLIADPDDGFREGQLDATPHASDEKQAIREAQADLAQLGWLPSDGMQAPPFLKDRAQVAEFHYWVEFQVRYRGAIAKGLNHPDAHSYATRDPSRRDLIPLVEG